LQPEAKRTVGVGGTSALARTGGPSAGLFGLAVLAVGVLLRRFRANPGSTR
jgi:hypothetical protein